MAEGGSLESNAYEVPRSSELPAEIKDWDRNHVREWILGLANECAQTLYNQNISGPSLLKVKTSDLLKVGIKQGPAALIITSRDELVKLKAQQSSSPENRSSKSCKPYPFNQFHAAYRYKENSVLDVTETGALDLIEPCHEYKSFTNFGKQNVSEEKRTEEMLKKFTDETIRFAAACMNSRTNGTIHFGVGDKPHFSHGQILGAKIEDKEAFVNILPTVIANKFEHKQAQVAKYCIKPPRFVEVLKPDMTSSGKYVIEVDIEPSSSVCEDIIFHIYSQDKKMRKAKAGEKFLYIRDGSSSKNLLADSNKKEKSNFVNSIVKFSKRRQEAEEKHLTVVKDSVQGYTLCEMITGGSLSLNKSHFERYVLVTNKSHPVQKESLAFLLDMKLTAVLDFDPESAETGLNKLFEERNFNVHLPSQYKITEAVEEIAKKLKLTRTTSWVFYNGRIKEETPSDVDNWLTEKGSSIRDVVSFLCRKDVLPSKKFLIIFMLLSDVSDRDPMLEAFSRFLQELKGTDQILCICGNENSYTYWKELIEARYRVNISSRSIYELSFAEINGTVLSLWSENRKSSRFLPGRGGSKVLLPKEVESKLDSLSILCVNQCEGGNEDKLQLEESFYKGGKVSWWNFYFSEQPGSVRFIKRDKFDHITKVIIPTIHSFKRACVRFNILHTAGCGGTTLAMHVLWTLKEKFRCAVLKGRTVDVSEVAQQVVTLLTHEATEQQSRLPVLLMIDDFEDTDAVNNLQQQIEEECLNRNVTSKSPQVILLNCMRAESEVPTESTDDTVFIGNKLLKKEQKFFKNKLKEIEKIYTSKKAETFYGFMILKKDPKKYIQGVVKHTLKDFNFKHKHAQLIAVLVLLDRYCRRANLSVSVCEEFLGLSTKADSKSCKVEDGFGKFSTLLTRCTVESSVVFEAVRVIHPSMAEHCLKELSTTYKVSKAQITDFLLTTDLFYDCIQGKEKLVQDVHNMLVRRNYSAENLQEDCKFSPLIQAIEKETPGLEENVLRNAAKRFPKDAVISQLLSRYLYLRKKDFREAKDWAQNARENQSENSYICDTSARVIKHELKHAISSDRDNPITPDKLKEYLKMALSATEAFKETQEIARKEVLVRYQGKKDFSPYNTAGRLGEIQIAITVIDLLERIPVFSKDELRHRILTQVLSGKMKIQDVAKNDPRRYKHALYYHFLQEFADFLYNLKDNMKKHFDFLDNYFVNLGSFYFQKDNQEVRTRQEVARCFRHYANLFCSSDAKELLKKGTLSNVLKVDEARQYLEKNRADSYSGLLKFLSSESSAENIEQIVREYNFILKNTNPRDDGHFKDTVNFIYANIVLSQVKCKSKVVLDYKNILKQLCDTLKRPIPLSESLPLHFISVVMLWPETSSDSGLSDKLGSYVSQLRISFSNEMKPVLNGKRAVVHFYLGRKTGYQRLITQKEIDKCVGSEQSMQSGNVWKNEKVRSILRKLTGTVDRYGIMADTPNENLKVTVSPLFKSQLYGELGAKVSFFVGFTMNGPVALGIQPESD